MSITVKEQFDIWKQEAKESLGKVKKAFDKVVEPIQRTLKTNTIENIPVDFGKFLYSCLGERITGQRSSVLNQTWLNSDAGKRMVELANEKKCSIEKYLEKHDCDIHTWNNNKKEFHKTQAYITAGRRFGVSYVTGEGNRTHTIFFEEGSIFNYMTQDHVDCVLNKEKKECSQSFLNFRNEFVAGLKALNQNNIIELNVSVKVAKIVTLSTAGIFDRYGNSSNNLSALVVEQIYDDVVEFATIAVPELEIWNKISRVDSGVARHTQHKLTPCFSIQFGSLTGKTNAKSKGTKTFGNLDISVNEFKHTLNTVDGESSTPIVGISDTNDLPCLNDIVNSSEKNERYYNRNLNVNTDGIVMNMIDLFNHPAIQDAIKNRMDFFMGESKKLQELKHKYSALYFLNSD